MKTKASIEALLKRVKFDFFGQTFTWEVMEKGDGFLIRLSCMLRCVKTNEVCPQKGGKHYISQYSTDTEVIFKALKACKDFVDHELHEAFYVDDVRIFDPHIDLDSLVRSVSRMKRTSRDGSWYPPIVYENM